MRHRNLRLAGAVLVLAAFVPAALADTNSGRYKFEGNKWLSLDLAVGDVRVETIRFEWPATLLRVKTGYKATVKVANRSYRRVAVGLGHATHVQRNDLVGARVSRSGPRLLDSRRRAHVNLDFERG